MVNEREIDRAIAEIEREIEHRLDPYQDIAVRRVLEELMEYAAVRVRDPWF